MSPPGSPSKILVVEDDEMLRVVLARFLGRAGFGVLAAASGRAALEIVEKTPVDLVLSDVRMPNGNGLELLQELRRRDAHDPIFFFLTGYADLTNQDALAMGAQAMFAKPFNGEALTAEIRKALEQREGSSHG